MSKNKGSKRKNSPKIDPEMMPLEMTQVGPHKPIVEYFDGEDSDVLSQWVEFFVKKPKIGARELLNAIILMAGAEIDIPDKDFSKRKFEPVHETIKEKLVEFKGNSMISKYLSSNDKTIPSFWSTLCNMLIPHKGLYIDEFDIFKEWIFNFCDSDIRPLRESSVVSVLQIMEFLADSISKSNEGISKLKKSKSKSAVASRQEKDFQNELDSAIGLSMQLFTTVLKRRFRDVDPNIRLLCVQTTAKLAQICPQQFENDNILKHLSESFKDENSKLKKEALKQAKGILEHSEDKGPLKSFFKRIMPSVIQLCEDPDNSIAVAAFDLLSEGSNNGFSIDKTSFKQLFELTSDENTNVRCSAARFFVDCVFKGEIKKSVKKQGGKHELYEAQLRKFASLASDFNEPQLLNSVESHWKHLKCLKEYELICQILIGSDDIDDSVVFSRIISSSANVAFSKQSTDSLKELTRSLVSHFKELFDMYSDNQIAIVSFISAAQYFDLSSIEKAAGNKQLADFMKTIHQMFTKTENALTFTSIINSLNSWAQSDATPAKTKKAASQELQKIADELIKPGINGVQISKTKCILEYVDRSMDTSLRRHLITVAEEQESPDSIACLETIFKWDVLRLKKCKETEIAEYSEDFHGLMNLFLSKLKEESEEVKEASFRAISTLIALSPHIRLAVVVDERTIYTFFESYHSLEHKEEMFPFLIRPISCRAVPAKYAMHALWYLQDSSMKPLVKQFMADIEEMLPIEGSELGKMIRNTKYNEHKLKLAIKSLYKKIQPRSAIESWIEQPDESFIPLFGPLLQNLPSDDAELLLDRSSGKLRQLIEKRSLNIKLSSKDLEIKTKSSKRVDSSTEEYQDSETEE